MKKRNNNCLYLVHQQVRAAKGLLYYSKHIKNYISKLFIAFKQHKQEVLAYQILDDTVYLLISGNDLKRISIFLQHLHGVVAADYARSKNITGPFWSMRPQYVFIQKGCSFRYCLKLILTLPVERARATHPADWPHSSFVESITPKKKYRIVNLTSLRRATGQKSHADFTTWLLEMAERATEDQLTIGEIAEAMVFGEGDWINSIITRRPYNKSLQQIDLESATLSLLSGPKNYRKNLEPILRDGCHSY